MPVTITFAILAILAFPPTITWAIQHEQPMDRILLPFVASIADAGLLLIFTVAWFYRNDLVKSCLRHFWGVHLAVCLGIIASFLLMVPLFPVAEMLAEPWAEEYFELQYPHLAHGAWIGSWRIYAMIPTLGIVSSPVWMIILAIWLGIARLIDFVLRRV
jgi:hypothetical protein